MDVSFFPYLNFVIVTMNFLGQIEITPFRYANVPPPMSYFSIELTAVPIDLAFSPSGKCLVALQPHGIDLITWKFQKRPSDATPMSFPCAVNLDDRLHSRQILFITEYQLCVLGEDQKGHSSIYFLKFNSQDQLKVEKLMHLNVDRTCMMMESFNQPDILLCQDYSGSLIKYDIMEEKGEPFLDLPYKSPWLCTIGVNSKVIGVYN